MNGEKVRETKGDESEEYKKGRKEIKGWNGEENR